MQDQQVPQFTEFRLLVDEGGRTLWRTFRGRCLVGLATRDGLAVLGMTLDDGTQWCVFQGLRGRLIVYNPGRRSSGGRLEVFESFEELEGKIPGGVFEKAAVAAGFRAAPPDPYPVEPLDV